MEPNREALFLQLTILIHRLERISADSIWARRVSGVRGALLRFREDWGRGPINEAELLNLLEIGYDYLIKAAKEIPDNFE